MSDVSEPLDLGVAFAEVDSLMPEGWHFGELLHTSWRDNGERWLAMAWRENEQTTFEHGYGDTKLLALRALAAKLRGAA